MPRYRVKRRNTLVGYTIFFIVMFLLPLSAIVLIESPWKLPEKESQEFWWSIIIATIVCIGIIFAIYLFSRRLDRDVVCTNEMGLEYWRSGERVFVYWNDIIEVRRSGNDFFIKTPRQSLKVSLFFQPEDEPKRPFWYYIDKGALWNEGLIDLKYCELLQEVRERATKAKFNMEIPKSFSKKSERQ